MISTLDAVIESLVDSQSDSTTTLRQKHLFRESLRGLVRLAQADQLRAIGASVTRLTATAMADALAGKPVTDARLLDPAQNSQMNSKA